MYNAEMNPAKIVNGRCSRCDRRAEIEKFDWRHYKNPDGIHNSWDYEMCHVCELGLATDETSRKAAFPHSRGLCPICDNDKKQHMPEGTVCSFCGLTWLEHATGRVKGAKTYTLPNKETD